MDPINHIQTGQPSPVYPSNLNAEVARIQSQILDEIPAVRADQDTYTPQIRRLVVIVPGQEIDEIRFSEKIIPLIKDSMQAVLLFSLISDAETGTGADRRLATIGALLRSPGIDIQTRVISGREWAPALNQVVTNGDQIICPAEMADPNSILWHEPLYRLIASQMKAPVAVISGLYMVSPRIKTDPGERAWIRAVMLLVLALLVLLDTRFTHVLLGWEAIAAIVIIIALEIRIYFSARKGRS
jgi:hypothetical protein